MKRCFDIVLQDKQDELHRVVEIIREEFEPDMSIPAGVAYGRRPRPRQLG